MSNIESSNFLVTNSNSATPLSGVERYNREIAKRYEAFMSLFDFEYLDSLDPVSRVSLLHSFNLTLSVIRDLNRVSGESEHIRLMYLQYLRLARQDYFNNSSNPMKGGERE